MAKPQKEDMESTRALMGALVRMPPKQHDAMKKNTKKRLSTPKKKAAPPSKP